MSITFICIQPAAYLHIIVHFQETQNETVFVSIVEAGSDEICFHAATNTRKCVALV